MKLLLLLPCLAFAQQKTMPLDKAKAYIEKQPVAAIYQISSADDLYLQANGHAQGDVFIHQYIIYQVYKIRTDTTYVTAYIYLDGSKLSKAEIDTRRTAIFKKYNAGTSFTALAKEYNMDKTLTLITLGL